eukprot:TRINITY_DN32978_c1_g1_i1.p1 TRINITY_DN32978_c1_g1~~TRINITY_DN32978_c1_g1_i1.p1  ORF type:complete len:103 (-),score=12.38 TRINITY_DN32978_c1_g1_i1:394-702(-)
MSDARTPRQLDPQSLAVQSVGVLIGCPLLIAGNLPRTCGSRVNMKAGPEADKFGAFLMAKFRDAAIDHADALLAAHWKAPGLQSLQNDLRQLSPEQTQIVLK